MTTYVFRFSAIASVVMLVACGGGGDPTAGFPFQPPPEPTGTLTVSKEKCKVEKDQSDCSVTLTGTTKDAASAVVTDSAGKTYQLKPNMSDTLVISGQLGQTMSYRLAYGGKTETPPVTVTWTCDDGVYADNSTGTPVCKAVLRYEPMVIGDANLAPNTRIFTGPTCADVAKAVTWTTNVTPYQITPTNPRPLGQRGYYKTPLPSGRIPMFGVIFEKNDQREALVLNPVTWTIDVYDGSEGPFAAFGPTQADVDPGWISTSEDSTDPALGNFAETSAWMIYNKYDNSREVFCRNKDGAGNLTGDPILLPGTDNDIQYRNFTAYSN